MKKNVQPVLDQ